MKVSIDFDGTLSTKKGQQIARDHLMDGDDVHVLTARPEDGGYVWAGTKHENNDDLFEVTDELGIPRDKIRFTNYDYKWQYLNGFNVHYDDDPIELELIRTYMPSCKAIQIRDI